MRWKLTTLIENHVDKEERYMCEHGLAILIESENQEEQVCLLMDTGKSGCLLYTSPSPRDCS